MGRKKDSGLRNVKMNAIRRPVPEIVDWQLYFLKTDGNQNRLNILKAFSCFWNDEKNPEIKLPGICLLGGRIYGHAKIVDGNTMMTSIVRSIKRLSRVLISEDSNNYRTVFLVETEAGEQYEIRDNDLNRHMFEMLDDIANNKLNYHHGHYIGPNMSYISDFFL